MTALRIALIVIICYFLGNISPSTILARRRGVDIRKQGSGNAGSTNVIRSIGVGVGLLTFLLDVLKGALASFVGYIILGSPSGVMIGGVSAIVGHNWPALYRFKGGKGIAASVGTMLVVQPIPTLVLLLIGVVIILTTGVVSYASLSLTLAYFLFNLIFHFHEPSYILFSLAICLLAWIGHRENIGRILSGEEKNRKISLLKRR